MKGEALITLKLVPGAAAQLPLRGLLRNTILKINKVQTTNLLEGLEFSE